MLSHYLQTRPPEQRVSERTQLANRHKIALQETAAVKERASTMEVGPGIL
jgi:hypothetical protein